MGGIREWLCDLFKCPDFTNVKDDITSIKGTVEGIDGKVDALDLKVVNVDGKVSVVEGKVDTAISGIIANGDMIAALALDLTVVKGSVENIEAQFPITVEPDPEVRLRLVAVERVLEILSKPEFHIWSYDVSGSQGSVVDIPVYIKGESLKEIKAFGIHAHFDGAVFQFNAGGILKGDLTQGWAGLDGNEASPGDVTIGGYLGGGTGIIGTSAGVLFTLRFTVVGTGDGVIMFDTYIDDLVGMLPMPFSVAFTNV